MILSFEFIIGGYFSRIYQLTKTKNLSNIRRIAATCWLLSVDQTRNPLTNKLWLRTLIINSFIFKVTTLTPRPSARLSTSAQLTEPVASPSTASSAPTEPSSTRTTSSATGGSTLTAPPLLTSTASMMSMLPRGTPCLEPLAMPRPTTLPPFPLMTATPPPPPPSTPLRLLDAALDVRDPQAAPAGEEDSKQILVRQVTASTNISRLCISSQCNVPHSAIIC